MAQRRIDQLNINTISPADLLIFWKTNNTFAMTKEDFDLSIGDVSANNFKLVDTHKATFDISGLSEDRTYTFPDVDTTLVGLNTTQTLTNKTISPANNTIDGDILDIDYVPTNYTRQTGTPGTDVKHLSAHLRGINNVLQAVTPGGVKETIYFIPFVALTVVGGVGQTANVPYVDLGSGQGTNFVFLLPNGYESIESLHLVGYQVSGTPTVNVSLSIRSLSASITSFTNQSISIDGTASQVQEYPISLSSLTFTSVEAGNYMFVSVERTAGTPRIVGLKIKLKERYVI